MTGLLGFKETVAGPLVSPFDRGHERSCDVGRSDTPYGQWPCEYCFWGLGRFEGGELAGHEGV
jgi:hypothetical protein